MWIGLLHIRGCSRALWDSAMKVESEKETGETRRREQGDVRKEEYAESRRDENGRERTREEPRCSGLARRVEAVLAALRQLGGVRRGIEIANAHYGYFPIEGRISLSFSLSLLRSLTALLALSHSARPCRTLSTHYLLHLSLSPPSSSHPLSRSLRSFAPYTHQFAFVPSSLFLSSSLTHCTYFVLSRRIFAYTRIARNLEVSPLSLSLCLRSRSFGILSLSSFSLSRARAKLKIHGGKAFSRRSRSHFPVSHSCLSF